jgi:hypothetical protein
LDVFEVHRNLVADYRSFTSGFVGDRDDPAQPAPHRRGRHVEHHRGSGGARPRWPWPATPFRSPPPHPPGAVTRSPAAAPASARTPDDPGAAATTPLLERSVPAPSLHGPSASPQPTAGQPNLPEHRSFSTAARSSPTVITGCIPMHQDGPSVSVRHATAGSRAWSAGVLLLVVCDARVRTP